MQAPSLSRAEYEALLYERARRRFAHYLPYIVLRSDDPLRPEPVPMQPYAYQRDLAARWDARESMVILKARQIGASVLLRAYALWRASQHGWAVGYYSRGQDEAVAWLDGVQAMAEALPEALRVPVHRRGDLLELGEGSVRVHPSTQAAGIGYTYQLVIADEAAHHAYGSENYANYAPTLSAGGQFVCLSTANPQLGPSGWFYEMWEGAQNGTLPYSPVFLAWNVREGRDAAWLAARRAELAGNEQAFSANYPERPEDAFVGREGLVYPMFDRARHFRAGDPVPWEECRRRYFGTDYGGGDPSAAPVAGLWRRAGEDFSRLHVYDLGYWNAGRAPSVDELYAHLGPWHARARFHDGAGDPAPGGEVINESLRALGLPCRRAHANRDEGISLVAQFLDAGWLTFNEARCEAFLREFASYRWVTRIDQHSRERYATKTAQDHHADALDALRYLVMAAYYDEWAQQGQRTEPGRYDTGVSSAPQSIRERIAARASAPTQGRYDHGYPR